MAFSPAVLLIILCLASDLPSRTVAQETDTATDASTAAQDTTTEGSGASTAAPDSSTADPGASTAAPGASNAEAEATTSGTIGTGSASNVASPERDGLNGQCGLNQACTGTDLQCDFMSTQSTCKITAGKACGDDSECVHAASCVSSYCQCDETISDADPTDTFCNPKAGFLGGSCNVTSPCRNDTYALCDEKSFLCLCGDSYTMNVRSLSCEEPPRSGAEGEPENSGVRVMGVSVVVMLAAVVSSRSLELV